MGLFQIFIRENPRDKSVIFLSLYKDSNWGDRNEKGVYWTFLAEILSDESNFFQMKINLASRELHFLSKLNFIFFTSRSTSNFWQLTVMTFDQNKAWGIGQYFCLYISKPALFFLGTLTVDIFESKYKDKYLKILN